MTGLLVLTILGRYCHILVIKASTTLTVQQFPTYYPQPIDREVLPEHICYSSSIVRTSHVSTLYDDMYIIWDILMSVKCADVAN